MSERALTDSVDETSSRGYPRAFDTILYGGLAVGVLDGLAAAIIGENPQDFGLNLQPISTYTR